MQKFLFVWLKLVLNFFSGEPKLPYISRVGSSPINKMLFFRLTEWDDELLWTPKIPTSQAKPQPKFYESFPSNAI